MIEPPVKKQFHDFDIVNDGAHGRDAEIWMDGIKLVGVTRYNVEVNVTDATRIVIELIAGSINKRQP